MADLIVSPVVNLVKEKVVAYLQDQYELHSGVAEKLKKLEDVLIRIETTLKTAVEVDFRKHKDLEAWMRKLKVAAEEANDVLDEFEYLRLERQAEGDGADDELRFCPPSWLCLKSFTTNGFFRSLFMYANRFIRSTGPLEKLRSIQSKLEELDSTSQQFLLVVEDRKTTDREHERDNRDDRKRETSSSMVEPEFIGRKEKLEEIIQKLLEEEEEEELVSDRGSMCSHVPLLSVVGHGGMGKTTLAQHVYNDTRVAAHFQLRIWAYVSQHFDVQTLTMKIIESVDHNVTCSDTNSLQALQQKLKDSLKSRRFLLVLDDVWYSKEMEEQWKKLCGPLKEAGGKGSKIMLTSRTPEVEELAGALIPSISLQELTPDDCWSIIQRSAFRGSGIPSGCGDLVAIGREIAHRVCGSPLAAKAVGGILRKDMSRRHWSSLLNTKFSELPGKDLMAVLRLSYQYLPSHLRQCFAYCSLFPKGHVFNVDMLVRMWVAHGYIQEDPARPSEQTEEDMGLRYFDDLLSAGFFTRQIVEDDQRYEVMLMHDLMNDLARFVSKDEFVRIEDTLLLQDGFIPDTVRHLSLSTHSLAELINKKCDLSKLESFLLFPGSLFCDYAELDKLVKEALQQLRRVRVLDLGGCEVKDLPDDVRGWVHLRFLDLHDTNIISLPESFWRLYHLQVLSISEVPGEYTLEKLNQLGKLRFIVYYQQDLKLAWIRGLKSLQVLRGVLCVERGRGREIENLKSLNELQESLILINLDYVESSVAAREADLSGKKRLQELVLKWNYPIFDDHGKLLDRSPKGEEEVLEALQPPSNLERLKICNYTGMLSPNWMGNHWLANLRTIHLQNLLLLKSLPPLGQLPFLEKLKLKCLPKVTKLSQEGFPSLKLLVIKEMNELEEWAGPDGSGGLPCLEVFRINECPNLTALPTISPTVKYLKIENVGITFLPGLSYDHCLDEGRASMSNGAVSSPSNLSELSIEDCGNLTSLGEGLLQNQQRLSQLEEVTICSCKLLESLPDVGFRELHSLRTLEIVECPNLTWLSPSQDPDRGLLPTSLQELVITNLSDETMSRCLHGLNSLCKMVIKLCPCLKSMPPPDEMCYLSSLWNLRFLYCEALTPSGMDGLRALPSLKLLSIEGCPGLLVETSSSTSPADGDEGMSTGPFSLAIEHLEIEDPLTLINVPVLKSLTSVQQVKITNASRLISFSPEVEEWLLRNGKSLEALIIKDAQQLQSLPKLPNTLNFLCITKANQEFKKRHDFFRGPDWWKIRHIEEVRWLDY